MKRAIHNYSRSLGLESCDSISTDEVWPTNIVGQVNTNFNLTGAGITLAMWELNRGLNETHQEFAGRVLDLPYGGGGYISQHPNAVAAVMVGAGVRTNVQGAAYEATLQAYRWNGDLSYLTDVANEGVIRFSNHSYETLYGSYGYGAYTPIDEARDRIIYTAYYHLPVFAVGNEWWGMPPASTNRYDTLNAGIAKNVLSVGAVEDLLGGYTGATSVVMTTYSSWGPTDDGRIKPDLVASGYSGWVPHLSTNNAYYPGMNGTSFAAPAVTGSLGLLQELNEELYGTNVPLLASTYKGLAIHTADEADAPGPDYRFGWGLMNTHSAAQLMTENAKWNSSPFIKEFVLPDGDYVCFSVEADTNLPLRVTICWSDPPGEELINDIDLRIIDPSGQTNFPWVLIPIPTNVVPAYTAIHGDNTRDNVEQVEITNTVAGAYTVFISHKGTLVNAEQQPDGQELSVILSGFVPENIDPEVALSFTTNGFPRLEMSGTVGSLFEVSRTYNLPYVGWVEVSNSPLSVLHTQAEWIDPGGSTNPIQFYKIELIK